MSILPLFSIYNYSEYIYPEIDIYYSLPLHFLQGWEQGD